PSSASAIATSLTPASHGWLPPDSIWSPAGRCRRAQDRRRQIISLLALHDDRVPARHGDNVDRGSAAAATAGSNPSALAGRQVRTGETSMNCRICGSGQIGLAGIVEFFSGYAFPIFDCADCDCRFTWHDPSAYESFYAEARSCYRRYLDQA